MPTKRTRITRSRRDLNTPQWAIRLRDHGELPDLDSDEHDEYTGWLYFDEHVPGLPDDWREKDRLAMRCQREDA